MPGHTPPFATHPVQDSAPWLFTMRLSKLAPSRAFGSSSVTEYTTFLGWGEVVVLGRIGRGLRKPQHPPNTRSAQLATRCEHSPDFAPQSCPPVSLSERKRLQLRELAHGRQVGIPLPMLKNARCLGAVTHTRPLLPMDQICP